MRTSILNLEQSWRALPTRDRRFESFARGRYIWRSRRGPMQSSGPQLGRRHTFRHVDLLVLSGEFHHAGIGADEDSWRHTRIFRLLAAQPGSPAGGHFGCCNTLHSRGVLSFWLAGRPSSIHANPGRPRLHSMLLKLLLVRSGLFVIAVTWGCAVGHGPTLSSRRK